MDTLRSLARFEEPAAWHDMPHAVAALVVLAPILAVLVAILAAVVVLAAH